MQIPLQVVFRDVPRSDALDAEIRRRAEKLNQFHDHITSCRVTVAHNGRHKHQGNRYNIGIDITLPGTELVIKDKHDNEDVYVALRDAFEAAQRKLHEYARQQRGEVKVHRRPEPQAGPDEQ